MQQLRGSSSSDGSRHKVEVWDIFMMACNCRASASQVSIGRAQIQAAASKCMLGKVHGKVAGLLHAPQWCLCHKLHIKAVMTHNLHSRMFNTLTR